MEMGSQWGNGKKRKSGTIGAASGERVGAGVFQEWEGGKGIRNAGSGGARRTLLYGLGKRPVQERAGGGGLVARKKSCGHCAQ